MRKFFNVSFLEDVIKFLSNLDEKARTKIIYNIDKASYTQDPELFKKLTENIWEFRTSFNKTYYRFFAFWDKSGKADSLVICTNAIIKKTKKTPLKEIKKAEKIRLNYISK
ncbi:type II toxin-antitoxin system RelE/ParE family toxin [bacterium]|nr:MAG: type II toxin-antitoxin system RelE/ParE family toxin [bacterium]